MTENEISKVVIDAGLKVHKALGMGLYETVYEQCLAHELTKRGLYVERQKFLSIIYDDLEVNNAFKVDLLVENKVVIEVKAQENLIDFHAAQLMNYLKLGDYRLGLLLNFNSKLFKTGIKRIVNRLENETDIA
ncbi:GxxExxY protein [Elizabethkingia ursingii]|uniref:GxxExxY protein n=1 Tax=Elizabethkingia ursingii TaxID=1756150 RepID=UPI002012639F|nr:GxxExxY protein [Elizabethkingia ursingii]MCL1667658.1 GxxExxY protein [Elizabethkingia ursingii]